MDSPTLQTLKDPILLPPWVCYRGGVFPNPRGTCAPAAHAKIPKQLGLGFNKINQQLLLSILAKSK
jgi:hypothetical protein